MREQQTCPPTIYFNMWTVSSDVSIQRRHWQPLSAHLWSYCTHPNHDVNDVMCVGWPQHRSLRPLLFSNSGVGSFTSHKNQFSVIAVRPDLRFFFLIREDWKSNCLQMSVQRQHFLLSYLKTLSVGLVGMTSRSADRRSPNWACQVAVNLRTVLNNKTGFGYLKWFPSSVALTVSCSWGCEQNKKERTWENLALTQRTLGRVSKEMI